jgi:hypothetical protein
MHCLMHIESQLQAVKVLQAQAAQAVSDISVK